MNLRFLGRVILLVAFCYGSCASQTSGSGKYFVYVGTYTSHGGKGIYSYRFDPANGKLISLGLAAESDNPSFLTTDPTDNFLYAVNEVDRFRGDATGSVSAFAMDRGTGKLRLLNRVSAHAPGPAYLSMDRTGKYVLIANYPLGSVAVFPLLKDGALGEMSDFVRHKGSSVNKQRQEGPHAHAVVLSLDNRFALVADLGLDQVLVYPFDATSGKLGSPHVMNIKPGSGPRHLAFSPNGKFVYLVSEMGSTVTAFSYHAADGRLATLQTVSTLPANFSGQSTAAEIAIHPSGRFLYASNRGDDSIAVFALNPGSGRLAFLQRVSTQGKTPRNFALDPSGQWLLAANQDSNSIVSFRVDQETGELRPVGQVAQISQPACVVFVPLNDDAAISGTN